MNRVAQLYAREFIDVFGFRQGQPIVDGFKYSKVIADFETTILSGDAPVDAALAGDDSALSEKAKAGLRHFINADCQACHPAPLFTTGRLANNGVAIAQGQLRGGAVVPFDRGANVNGRTRLFKVPTLREIQRTAPYSHSGRWPDLKRVVQHYNSGGVAIFNGQRVRDPQIDSRIRPLGLTAAQEDELVAFLQEGFAGRDYPDIASPFAQ
jgi:cytochrome c peroxidase